jgi:transcriptional regulator with XRE-family HTH domain
MLQADLARQVGKTQSYVSRLESAERRLGVLDIFVIARALKIAPATLYQHLIAEVPEDVSI